MKKRLLLLSFLLFTIGLLTNAQETYRALSRYDYYTTEKEVSVAVWVPQSKENAASSLEITFGDNILLKGAKLEPGQVNVFELPADGLKQGVNTLSLTYMEQGKPVGSDRVIIKILPEQYNAVKIDRFSGGLIVEGLPFIPFGFYAYSPVQPRLAEQEVVKGFNMMSPYQVIEGNTLKERKAYMDRCAALGMKVNYNLLSIAGGGGVGNKNFEKLHHAKRMKMLRKEVESFRDHPALLSWYISDEPVGQGVPPDSLEATYELIKELDPYHPVTVVFMSPAKAKEYAHVMDIVMADPYPIPHGTVDEVGVVAAMLHKEFFLDKPLWIVPQAFGGNEHWEREPTAQELRAMTYLALVNHASGIQYFIRHGLNSFPKSTVAWNECGAIAHEVAELTPYIFSEKTAPKIRGDQKQILYRGFHYNGEIMVMAVNTRNEPSVISFVIEDFRYNGSAALPFEDRMVDVIGGKIEDVIDAYGTRVYSVRYMMPRSKGPGVNPKNMLTDPSFEKSVSPGIPSACYARIENKQGATYFTDPRTSARGQHSLRMTTPAYGEGIELSFKRLRPDGTQSYTMSVQAKALPLKYREKVKRNFFQKLCGCGPHEDDFPEFHMSFGECSETFIPGRDWEEYAFSCIPFNGFKSRQISPTLIVEGKGTAWFDLVQVYPDMSVKSLVNRNNNNINISIYTVHRNAEIFYTLDGSEPDPSSTPYEGNFILDESSVVSAVAYLDDKRVGYIRRYFNVNFATGRYVEYKHKYSPKYDAGLKVGLVDGIFGTDDFMDGRWQGFEGEDLDVIINLKEVREINSVSFRFLKNEASWIFLPEEIKVMYSEDGVDYAEFSPQSVEYYNEFPPRGKGSNYYHFMLFEEVVEARYIRVIAKNIGECPDGHPGAGGKAWLFADEIVVSYNDDLAKGIIRTYR